MTAIKHILIVFLLLPICVDAQDTLNLNLLQTSQLRTFGRTAMVREDFGSAVMFLSKFMERKPDNAKAAFWLAESYFKQRDYENALFWYERSYKLSGETYPMALFQQGLLLKMAGKCSDAAEKFSQFRKKAGNDNESTDAKRRIKAELAGCDSLVGQPATAKVTVTHLPSTINMGHIESSPVYINDSTILFTSLRAEGKIYLTEGDTASMPKREFHLARKRNETWEYAGLFPFQPGGVGENISSATLSPDGSKLYFSKCMLNWKGKFQCKLYYSLKDGSSWGEPQELPKSVNLKGTSSSQPAVGISSKGEELVYFISNRKDGKGGTDIWYTRYDPKRKTYRPARNAGSKINTRQDELSPWYDQEYRTLYFSSDGKPGIGGMDIYRSIGEYGRFTASENLREPVNSGYDDLYYRLAPGRKYAMFTSNRKEVGKSCCDDLFEVTRLEFVKIIVKGTVFSDDSIEPVVPVGATVTLSLYDTLTREQVGLRTIPVNNDGSFQTEIEGGLNYRFTGSATDYLNKSALLSTTGVTGNRTMEIALALPKSSDKEYTLSNVYYETAKYELTPASRISLDTTILVLLNENPTIKVEIGAHTDDVGTDASNMTLSQKRAEGVVKYLISQGIDPKRLVAQGYGETRPVKPNLHPDGTPDIEARAMNRRTSFRVIGEVKLRPVRDLEDDE